MRLRNCILCIVLAISAWGLQDNALYAQKKGSPESSFNAIDYRYLKWDDTPVVFADSVKFRNRFYNVFKGSFAGVWDSRRPLDSPKHGLSGGLTFGYRLTPVHAVEAEFIYGAAAGRQFGGMNIDYVMNLNNFALRKDGRNRLEALFVAGLSYRQGERGSVGMNTGIRLQWNPGINAGLFIEPRLNVMNDPLSSATFRTVPSISVGLTLRYHKPEYYLWDYLTPFAIKTNLLYDAASVLNVGIEAPVRDHWSVAFEWVFPWWSSYDRQLYLQMLYGSMEGRYWFGNRENKLQLTGWFAGISAGGGLYDFMFHPLKGIQGEFATCSAVAGYAHPINKSGTLRMEYSVGLGWIGTEYVKYWWDDYDYTLIAPSPQSWTTHMFGPTRVQVSLVYMLKIRSKVGGRE